MQQSKRAVNLSRYPSLFSQDTFSAFYQVTKTFLIFVVDGTVTLLCLSKTSLSYFLSILRTLAKCSIHAYRKKYAFNMNNAHKQRQFITG